MLNILFDGVIFKYAIKNNSSRTGIYWVAINILKRLIKNNNVNVSLFLVDKETNIEKIFDFIDVDPIPVVFPNDNLSKYNAFFSSIEVIPNYIKEYPNISCYTILYDAIPLLFPSYFKSAIQSWFYDLIANFKNNKEDYYFSISEYTKQDFIKYFPELNKENILTIPLSTNIEYNPNKDIEKLAEIYKKYSVPENKKYLFSLCSLEPRKNLIRAVKTFIAFINKNNIEDLVYVLGGSAWSGFIEKLEKEIPEYEKYKDKIIRAGYVADEDLEILYSNAEWFVYTSQYEGFGMPPLEAMACGCPVITSNNSSLPEVVGDAGIMIDWDSDEQHVQAYEKYYFDKNFRNEMAQKGLERSKMFSWEKAVDIILNKMYEVEERKAQKPLVTIITATYNLIDGGRKDWFIQNLESVENQTYKNIEHIVIDGASTDGTLDILEEYQNKGLIKYFSEPDKGIYDALNKGILKASGKYVVCLNSDDFYCDDRAVEWLVSKTEETGSDACYAHTNRVNPETLEFISDWPGRGNFIPWKPQFPCHQSFLIRTDVMKELGLYDLKYKVCSDNAFLIKMVKNNKKFCDLDKHIINFRDGGFSNDNMDIVEKEKSECLYNELGKFHGLTKYDCSQYVWNKFLNLPISEAIELGSKLDNVEWRKQYFSILINHIKTKKKKKSQLKVSQKINSKSIMKNITHKLFSVTNENSNKKKYKVLTILGIKIKFKKRLKSKKLLIQDACLKNLYKREYILLMDNLFDDNAELCDNFALFEYLQSTPEYKNISFYVINKNNVSFKEIKTKYPNNIVPVNNTTVSNELIEKLSKTKYWLDSFQVINFFNRDLKKYLKKSDIITVYTQHGINFMKTSFVESSNAIGDSVFKKIIFSNSKERQIFKKHYGYDDRNTILAGLSRWDNIKPIKENDEKIIFLYFTFRVYLRNNQIKLENTNYVRNIISLCCSKKLKQIIKENNVKLKIAVHHEVLNYMKNFSIPGVELVDEKDIGNIKNKASLFITDYSSMCFDFMYKDKPVIFYRIDYNSEILLTCWEDRVDQIYSELKNDDVYNVFYTPEDVINKIEEYCKNNFQLENEYKIKNNTFFAYRDNIRKQIIEGIIASPENIPNDCDREPFEDIEYGKIYDFTNDLLPAISTEYIATPTVQGRYSKGKYSRLWFRLPQKIESQITINLKSLIADKNSKHQFDIHLNDNLVETVSLTDKDKKEIKIRITNKDTKLKTQKLEFKVKSVKTENKNLQLSFLNMKVEKL